MKAPKCTSKIWSDPLLQCIRRQGHDGEHEAVDLASRTTYRWDDRDGWWDV